MKKLRNLWKMPFSLKKSSISPPWRGDKDVSKGDTTRRSNEAGSEKNDFCMKRVFFRGSIALSVLILLFCAGCQTWDNLVKKVTDIYEVAKKTAEDTQKTVNEKVEQANKAAESANQAATSVNKAIEDVQKAGEDLNAVAK